MNRFTLRRRFLLQNLLLVLGMLIAGAVALFRLEGVVREATLSRSVYAELRTIGNTSIYVGTIQGLSSDPAANRAAILQHLRYAIGSLDQFIAVGEGYGQSGDKPLGDAYMPIDQAAKNARTNLEEVQRILTENPEAPGASLRPFSEQALANIDHVATSCIGLISRHQQSAAEDLAKNVLLIGVFAVLAVAAAVLLSVWQYRQIIVPLERLRLGVRQVASAKFSNKFEVDEAGSSHEFRELIGDFNRMAKELDSFYTRLEEQVRSRSRELVRSERLASVGFLAAGVAHEINNPLNIISGYAELAARRLDDTVAPTDTQSIILTREHLRIIGEEAFRCKDITEKLLSLSRPGNDAREDLDLGMIAREVATMTQGLKNYRDRRLTLKLHPGDRLGVKANLTEMKQVLLNLTINALEATPVEGGEVCIEGHREKDWVELSVKDNGRGMGADVLPHIFEPFFSARQSSGDRGTGLGLSITHAIIENHRGRIEAQSDGPGRGAKFTIRLPAGLGGVGNVTKLLVER